MENTCADGVAVDVPDDAEATVLCVEETMMAKVNDTMLFLGRVSVPDILEETLMSMEQTMRIEERELVAPQVEYYKQLKRRSQQRKEEERAAKEREHQMEL